ncbi:MAG: TcpQ domain-containing protein [Alphaproteobacteria bacterium]|nr:TcpQ domain-containing protein [Alphaproteobacteria bacterium]
MVQPGPLPSLQPLEPLSSRPVTGAPESLAPVVIEGTSRSDVALEPLSPVVIQGENPSTFAPSSSSTGVVRGFANQVPLAVALRQILPPGYGFSVDQDVDLGVLVSFRGGKPWRETLKDALDPAGLVMREQDEMVSIGYASGGAPRNMASIPAPRVPSYASSASDSSRASLAPRYLEPPPGVQPTMSSPASLSSGASYSSSSVGGAQSWDAERGESLRSTLEQWARRSNVEFNWLAEYDYPLQASVHFDGTFEEAVRNLLTGFQTARPQPVAELHMNPKMGQMVLNVTTRGNTGGD